MKKRYFVITILSLLLVCGVAAILGCSHSRDVFYTVEYKASDGGAVSGETIQQVKSGESTTEVGAVANEGYEFVGWSDGKNDSWRWEDGITDNLSFTAEFKLREVFVNYDAGEGGYISGKTHQPMRYGEDGEAVQAMPLGGYKFIKWSDGNSDSIRTDCDIKNNITFTAEFEFLYDGGEGTKENPFVINTYQQLKDMSVYPENCYILNNDLDLSGVEHEPIFAYRNEFCGTFDGNGHIIKNLSVKSNAPFSSLFGVIGDGGAVRNLTFTNFELNASDNGTTDYAAGAVAGVAYGDLENITVNGKLAVAGMERPKIFVGAIAGYASGKIINCNANMSIEFEESQGAVAQSAAQNDELELLSDASVNIGGIAGGSANSIIKSCNVTGKIEVKQASRAIYVGGMIGSYISDSEGHSAFIENCDTDVDITGVNGNVSAGGLICLLKTENTSRVIVLECVTKGKTEAYNAAGFIYKIPNGAVDIYNCHVDGNVVAVSYASGFLYDATNVKLTDCYVAGNVETTASENGASGGCASGFFYRLEKNSELKLCYVSGQVKGTSAVGFAFVGFDCKLDRCYSSGDVTADLHGAGFAFSQIRGKIQNCYSVSNVHSSNTDANAGRTLIAGFVVAIKDSDLLNCYYGGNVTGTVYASIPATSEPMIGAFIAVTDNTNIINCHVLHAEKSFALEVIGQKRNSETVTIDLKAYDKASDMLMLAETLNGNSGNLIWVNRANNFPRLYFVKS